MPADTELAAIFVPSWARVNPAAMMKTPKRAGPLALSPVSGFSKKKVRRSKGFQIGSP